MAGGHTALWAMGGPAFNVLPLWPSQPLSKQMCWMCRKVGCSQGMDVQKHRLFSKDVQKLYNGDKYAKMMYGIRRIQEGYMYIDPLEMDVEQCAG